jgi:hypothetical protein
MYSGKASTVCEGQYSDRASAVCELEKQLVTELACLFGLCFKDKPKQKLEFIKYRAFQLNILGVLLTPFGKKSC